MRFLIEPVGIEAIGGFQQRRDLLGEPRPDRLGLAAGRGLGLLRESLDLVHALLQDLPERHALAPAHLDQIGERLLEGRAAASFAALSSASSLSGSTTSITPLMPSRPSMLGATASILRGQRARDLHDRRQHVLVDADRRDRVGCA